MPLLRYLPLTFFSEPSLQTWSRPSSVYSHDFASQLSLGPVLDLKNVALGLCKAEQEGGEGWEAVTKQ